MPPALCRKIDQPATSMSIEGGHTFDRKKVLHKIGENLEETVNLFISKGSEPLFDYLKHRDVYHYGDSAILTDTEESGFQAYEGSYEGFDKSGCLLLNIDGVIKKFATGRLRPTPTQKKEESSGISFISSTIVEQTLGAKKDVCQGIEPEKLPTLPGLQAVEDTLKPLVTPEHVSEKQKESFPIYTGPNFIRFSTPLYEGPQGNVLEREGDKLPPKKEHEKDREQPWTIRKGQEWKSKIYGKAQTDGHGVRSYREGIKAASILA